MKKSGTLLANELTQWHVAQQTSGGQCAGRCTANLIQQQVRCIFLEGNGNAHVIDTEKAAAGKRQIHDNIARAGWREVD